ncbi:solute carrier family 23 member 1-like [Mercenaria mercenaria]|uniref:solute carrier family 23 member 1-like n=1 Tax=Mercenaria mercenaria TaxID=6596 RepID=UPI00234E834B|nr:solute carrier family 23 member 1-like [Mercenaria mercenaria]
MADRVTETDVANGTELTRLAFTDNGTENNVCNETELTRLAFTDFDTEHSGEIKESETELVKDYSKKVIIYGVNESPPLHITIVCALQQGLSALSSQLVVAVLVAEVVCASNNDVFKARILSSTMFMAGISTIAMNLLGIRLPLFQGGTTIYVVPLMMMSDLEGSFCSTTFKGQSSSNMTSENVSSGYDIPEESMEVILTNVRALQGSLMVAGALHAIMGGFGLIGFLLKFIGPLTIVPTMILIFVFIIKATLKFVIVSWAISISTIALSVILFLYLSRYNMPVPVWTPSGGCRIIRYPVHQVFSILIAMLVNWLICGILTLYDVFPNDRGDSSYNARTDARVDVIYDAPWFTFPYPGQYGPPGISIPATVVFVIATFISILDSIADYYACARVSRVPPPPAHGVNRGILIEGICSFLSGTLGCGHATTTYGGNVGTIGVCKVASRSVFVYAGILFILFAVFGKFSAVFITIPDPVLGGSFIVMVGIFIGVMIGNLEVTSMSSPRNVAILGLAVCIGVAVPSWAQTVQTPIDTGNEKANRLIAMLLTNPNLVGTALACFLDNTVPGTRKERGILTEEDANTEDSSGFYNEGYEVYKPLFPTHMLRWKIMKYIPFLPYEGQ